MKPDAFMLENVVSIASKKNLPLLQEMLKRRLDGN